MVNCDELNMKKKWSEMIRIAEAKTDQGKMYYLLDDKCEFIPLIKEYLDVVQSRSAKEISPNTAKTYCYLLWYFVVFLRMNNLEILDLDGKPYILAQFKMWLKNPFRFNDNIRILDCTNYEEKENNLSISTINAIIGQVSSLYLWLKASNRIKENPVVFKNVILVPSSRDRDLLAHTKRKNTVQVNTLISKIPKTLPKTVEEDVFKRFLENVNLLRDKIILLCLKEGGFRSSELLGIHLEDVDFGEQGIWIRYRPDNENGARAKAGYGRDRFVNLSPALMILIDCYISSEWIESNPSSDYLFIVTNSNTPNQNGKPMTKSTLDSIFRYYSMKVFGYIFVNGKKIPQKHIHPHQLRHTHATELARLYIDKEEAINWKFISERLGHSSVTTTTEIYSHLTIGDYKKEYLKIQKYKELRKKDF